MPGPGGGGGGGRSGGGFGGGFGGGGYGGGGGFHGHHHGMGFGFFPFFRPYYYGGGCLSIFFAPIILLLISALILFSTLGASVSTLLRGGNIVYDENKIGDYADDAYAEIYGSYGAYEDNILIVVATESEEYWDYAYICWIGDHISDKVYEKFHTGGTFGSSMDKNINERSYKYSLDTDLARVVREMTAACEGLDPYSSTCREAKSGAPSTFVNRTDMEMTGATVEESLLAFTAATGIPISIVVDDAADIFGKTFTAGDVIGIIIAVALITFAVITIVRTVKNKKNDNGDWYDDATGNNRNKNNNNNYYWR